MEGRASEAIGRSCVKDFRVTQEMLSDYRVLSGDSNPLHFDSQVAQKSIFGRTIVPGLLVSAVASETVANVVSPFWVPVMGRCLFRKEVYLGELLRARAQIKGEPLNGPNRNTLDVDLEVFNLVASGDGAVAEGDLVMDIRAKCHYIGPK